METHILKSIKRLGMNFLLLGKWLFLASVIGIVVGLVSTGFAHAMKFVTDYRTQHTEIFMLLPVGGLIVVFLYRIFKNQNDRGTNIILANIHSKEEAPFKIAPLIIVSTVVSHLFGASVGREGAALQLGGSLGSSIGKVIKLDESDRKVMVMCGMSAAFAALFGTPMSAAIFAIEVVDVGVMYYAALVPCIFSALIASISATTMGISPEAFTIVAIPELTLVNTGRTILLAVICAVVSVVFCMMLHASGTYFKRYLKNPYIRVVVGSGIIMLITILLQTSDYMGAGINIIERAIEGEAEPIAFVIKILLTAIAIGCGFKGGEIVPSFFIGATLGCVTGHIIGLEPSLAAAVGMIAMFCSVTNCPISSTLIAFELFGYQAVPFFLIGNSVSYLMSGYYSLYETQMIVDPKYKLCLDKKGKRDRIKKS